MKISKLCSSAGASLLLLAACGGGGDGKSNEKHIRNMAGLWTGAFTKTSDTCAGSTATQTASFSHQVTQNNDAIELVDASGRHYLGNVVGGDGFSVDGTFPESNGNAQCSVAGRIQYNDIDDSDDPAATLEYHAVRSCPSGANCEIVYSGTASRNGVMNATPIPGQNTPTPRPGSVNTPVVASGGCAAINPRPAAGVYHGDGGCGISDAAFRVSGSTVVLEPFGANGATSFGISGANSSGATSSRSDLTINGESGYTCSMACSAPGTFTVTCFVEGGTSCVEKF